mgnify:CR=1 FL=1
MKRLVVLPADPLYKYYEKGEIKERYWNPCQFFDEVHIISLAPRDIEPAKVQTLSGAARLYIHPIGRPTMWTLPCFFGRVRRLVRKIGPDLIRAHGPWHTGSLAVHTGRVLNIPAVVSVHSDRDEQRRFEPSLLLHMVRPLERYSLSKASVVLCMSDYLHDYAGRHGATRTFTVYNKVYCDRFVARPGNRLDGPLRVLSVMRLDRAKYPECLIEAIAPLDVHLKLIGQGELEGSLRELVARLGLQDRCEFVRQVPNSEIAAHYLAADVFAMATHYEGFCIPVLEAMAAGLPIVASDTGPIPEVLAGTGCVVEKRPAAFTQALAALAADPKLRARMGATAKLRAEQVDGMLMEQREVRLYQALIDRRGDDLAELLADGGRYVN